METGVSTFVTFSDLLDTVIHQTNKEPFMLKEQADRESSDRYPQEIENWQPKQKKPQLSNAVICGIGSAFPKRKYLQEEVGALLGIDNRTVQKLLAAKHILTRHLYLPEPALGQTAIADESQEMLNEKFDQGVLDIGVRATRQAIADSPFKKSEIDFLVCVTSSGFRVPGLSSIIARALNLKPELYRLDVVGMGCNAGMSGLKTAQALAKEGKKGILLCCEINSAIYVRDESIRTGIVNSLFGDGAAAVVLAGADLLENNQFSSVQSAGGIKAEILGFESFSIPNQWGAMRFDWNQEQKKWSFGLSKEIPFVVGDHLKFPVVKLLEKNGLRTSDIQHWTIHTGGAAVIEGAKKSLGISDFDVRHTRSVLRDYGNISSGSFFVSYERLMQEGCIKNQDLGVLIAMGPGATLEACLVRYYED